MSIKVNSDNRLEKTLEENIRYVTQNFSEVNCFYIGNMLYDRENYDENDDMTMQFAKPVPYDLQKFINDHKPKI